MKKFVLSGIACAALIVALPDTASAHGGQYRGPGDVVPPNPGGGGPSTPGPSGPSTPGPSGPSTPGPSGPSTPGPAGPSTGGPTGPGGAGGPTTGRGGVQLDDDLTRWEFWWEFNKDPFINLKSAIHSTGTVTHSDEFFMGAGRRAEAKDTMKPTPTQIMNEILPKLKQALDSTEQRDINSSCMVAMAKIGKNSKNFDILPIFKERLTSRDQEIRETAALAMGISQMTEAVEDLVSLVKDDEAGRKLCDRGEVDDRTRSFAAYALGLVAYATSNNDVKRQCFDCLKTVLADEQLDVKRNIKVAAINAISILKPDGSDSKGKALLDDSIAALESYYRRKLGVGQQQVQAHVPPAVAKLLRHAEGDDIDAKKTHFKEMFLKDLQGKGGKKNPKIAQSAAVALGRLASPYVDKKSPDADVGEALYKYFQKGKDHQAKYFSLMALGQMGGIKSRDLLLKALKDGVQALEKPWAAISLGVYAYNKIENDDHDGLDIVGDGLQKWLGKLKNPNAISAVAVALGLSKHKDSADKMRELLEKYKNQDGVAGYLCIGLALMDDQRSVNEIYTLVKQSVRRPERLQQAAIALGKLGDKSVTTLLQQMMTEGDQNLAKMSAISSALGFIGDRRTIQPLVKMLFDESLTDLTRAFAAVALGGVADKELLPWNSKIATNMNYRAAVETLTNRQTGILDIL